MQELKVKIFSQLKAFFDDLDNICILFLSICAVSRNLYPVRHQIDKKIYIYFFAEFDARV